MVKNPLAMWETRVQSLDWEDRFEKGMATHSSILGLPLQLSWQRIRLQCRRPGFDPWVGKIPWRRLPTPIFWPGEFHGLYSSWGSKESAFTLPSFHVPQITCFPNLILVVSSLVQVLQRSKNVWNLNKSSSRTQLSATIQATSTTLTESPLQSNHQLFHAGSSLKHYFDNFKQFSLICKVQFTATNKLFCQAKRDKCVFQHH